MDPPPRKLPPNLPRRHLHSAAENEIIRTKSGDDPQINQKQEARISMLGEVVVYSPLGCPKLNVRLADETLWLTMQQLAVVFDVDRSVIGKHIRNIYKTGELDKEATWAKIAQLQVEGGRQVKRTLEYYNLDVVISVGYRVNSKRATQFRIWATNVIKSYLLRGKAENRELDDMKKYLANHEHRLSRVEQGVETIVKTLLPPPDPPRRRIGFHSDDETATKPYGRK